MSEMHHKGYKAYVYYDESADVLVGVCGNATFSLRFTGRSIDELRHAFKREIEVWEENCEVTFQMTYSISPSVILH